MKKVFFCFAILFLTSCELFPEKIGLVSRSPKSDVTIRGSYIKELAGDYHIFSKRYCDGTYLETAAIDTLTIDNQLYHQVYFVKIIPKNLKKDFRNLNMTPCDVREIYAKGDTLRKQMPGYGDRKFLVVENVVGVI